MATAVLVVALTACAAPSHASTASPAATAPRTVLGGFLDACNVEDDDARLSPDGHTVVLVWAQPTADLSTADASCILHKSGMPSDVERRINRTKASDGTQHASWDNYKATWSYAPATGAKLVLTDN